MNSLLAAHGGLQWIVGAPLGAVLLVKVTAILSVAWLMHLAIARANPRWRVLLWRATAVGLVVLPAIGWLLPALELRVLPSPVATEIAMDGPAHPLPSPFGRGTVGEGREWDVESGLPGVPPMPDASRAIRDDRARGRDSGETTQPRVRQSQNTVHQPEALTSARSRSERGFAWTARDVACLLLAAWGGGIAVLGLRLWIGHRRIRQMAARARRADDGIGRECARVARAVSFQRRVDVLRSDEIDSPFLCGLGRPVLLLPSRMCDEAYRGDLPGILAHELAHARSCDVRWNAALQAIAMVLWFHPLAWRMRRVHLAACELVCDAVSANFVGDVAGYCRTLARVAVEVCGPVPANGIAMARTSQVSHRLGALRKRVFHLPLRRWSVIGFGSFAMLSVLLVGAIRFATAEPPATAKDTAGAVRISAVDNHDQPIPGANVKIEGPDATVVAKSVTLNTPERKINATGAKAVKADARKSTGPKFGSLLVHVVDDAGKPIAGAKLWASYRGGKLKAVLTDAGGQADLALPAPQAGYIYLYASVDGYVPLRMYWTNQDGRESRPAECTFKFLAGRTIGGVVRDEAGRPIEGAKVELNVSSDDYGRQHAELMLWTTPFTTDKEGRWQFHHAPLKINTLYVQLEHPDYISDHGLRGIADGQRKQIEDGTSVMVMKRGTAVAGTVTGPDGKPVAKALVLQGDDRFGSNCPKTRTDAEGRYRCGSLAPGAATLTVVSRGLAPAIRDIDVRPDMGPVDFRLEKGRTLTVRVVDKDGKPVRGARVSPDTWRGRRTLCDVGIAGATDAEGRWCWTWAPEDAVEMSIWKDGRMNIRHLPLAPREAEHLVTIHPRLAISGRVIDAQTKQPIPSFRAIHGYVPGGDVEDKMLSWDRWRASQGKDGRYEVVINEPSEGHFVRIEAKGYQPATSRRLDNNEGRVTLDFALVSGKTQSVAVRLPDGRPAAGAEACLCPEPPGKHYNMALFVARGQFEHISEYDSTKVRLKAGPDGRLAIEPQDNGYKLIVLHDQGFAKTTDKELAAKPEITLAAWGRIEGVVRRGTRPVAGAKLDVFPAERWNVRWTFLNFHEQAETDADGKLVFPKLKPGKWNVRLLPAERGGDLTNQKLVEVAPGGTCHVAFGGGQVIVGRVLWPDGKTPPGDLSKIGANIRLKLPEMPAPPVEVRDQGPDAARAWMKQWRESAEGKAWQAMIREKCAGWPCSRYAKINPDGSFRIEEMPAGQYELSVYVAKPDEQRLPWERPELLDYEGRFAVPGIPGGVSDQPLDLGDVPLADKTRKELSLASVQPPAPQAPGEQTVGGLRDQLDLLRYVIATNRQNAARIRTWQGKATVERRSTYARSETGQTYHATVEFVFDRERKSVRWNETLDRWTRIMLGRENPRTVPRIISGMATPEAFYRFGGGPSGDEPADPNKRPLTLGIHSLVGPGRGQMEPQLYDFNPLYYLETPRGSVADDLSFYAGASDHPNLSRVKVIREGDLVTVDMSMDTVVQRYTVSLSQGCSPVRYETIESKDSTWEYAWTHERRNGVWLPKTWTETIRAKGSRDEDRRVTFVENRLNEPVDSSAFTLTSLGVERGDKVQDRRAEPVKQYRYEEP